MTRSVHKSWKSWVYRFALFSCLLLALVGGTNFIVDPLWIFGNNNYLNRRRIETNMTERQLKTNYLPHIIRETEGIVIGSSMTMTINTRDFHGLKVYNYASPGLTPDLSAEFVRHAVAEKGGALTAFIGVDAWSILGGQEEDSAEPVEFYVQNSKRKFKDIFSSDAFRWALKSVAASVFDFYQGGYTFIDNFPMYHVSQDVNVHGVRMEEASERVIEELAEMTVPKRFNDLKYYSAASLERAKELTDIPDIKPIFFITPVTQRYLAEMIKIGGYPTYEKFIRDSVNIFGSVWNFMYVNSVTDSFDYFFDLHHIKDKGGRAIAQRLSGGTDYPSDFGVFVTKENLDEHLHFLRENIFEALSVDHTDPEG